MDNQDWTIHNKPYDLRERLFLFACLIVRVVQFLHTRGPVAAALSYQILKSGTSAGANYEEADDGSSDRDSLAKKRITLRELKRNSVATEGSARIRLSDQGPRPDYRRERRTRTNRRDSHGTR
jgi:four helix bundle protein